MTPGQTITFKDGSKALITEEFETPTGRTNHALIPVPAIRSCTHNDDEQLVRDHAFYLTTEEIHYNI